MDKCLRSCSLGFILITLLINVLITEQGVIKNNEAKLGNRAKRSVFLNEDDSDRYLDDKDADSDDEDDKQVIIGFLVPRRLLKRSMIVDSLGGDYLMKRNGPDSLGGDYLVKRNVPDSLGGDYLIGRK